MSGGATPSSTALRTRWGYCRMYSSAARVPYEPPQRLTCSAPRRARTASKSRTAIQVAYCRRSPRSSFRQAPSRSICCDCSNGGADRRLLDLALERVRAAGAALVDEHDVAPRVDLVQHRQHLPPGAGGGLAGATREDEHRVGLLVARDRRDDREADLDGLALRLVRVLRHRHRAAADFAVDTRDPAAFELRGGVAAAGAAGGERRGGDGADEQAAEDRAQVVLQWMDGATVALRARSIATGARVPVAPIQGRRGWRRRRATLAVPPARQR